MIPKREFLFLFSPGTMAIVFWANIVQPEREIEGEFREAIQKWRRGTRPDTWAGNPKTRVPPPYKLSQCCRPDVSSFNNPSSKYSLYTSWGHHMVWDTICDWHFTSAFLDYSLWWAIFSTEVALPVCLLAFTSNCPVLRAIHSLLQRKG